MKLPKQSATVNHKTIDNWHRATASSSEKPTVLLSWGGGSGSSSSCPSAPTNLRACIALGQSCWPGERTVIRDSYCSCVNEGRFPTGCYFPDSGRCPPRPPKLAMCNTIGYGCPSYLTPHGNDAGYCRCTYGSQFPIPCFHQ